MTKVKICGITNVKDALATVDAGADMIGFVLSDSPRRVTYDVVAEISAAVNQFVETVGVFAIEEDLRSFDIECEVALDYYQVYFSPEQPLQRRPAKGWIRSYWISDSAGRIFFPADGYVLCDFKNSDRQAMSSFLSSHSDVVQNQGFVAGNLTSENVAEIVRKFQPYGVDTARGTEKSPGIKDHDLIWRFVREAKDAVT